MRLHPNVIGKLLTICHNQGGYTEETRLIKSFTDVRLSVYARQEAAPVLVETELFLLERTQRGKPVDDIVPMKLNNGAVKKLLELYRSYSGHTHESKLKNAFFNLDFTPYTTSTGESILILTEEYMRALQNTQ